MKKLKIKSKLISLEEQLEILEKAKLIICEYERGLCYVISDIINTMFIKRKCNNHPYHTYPDIYCTYTNINLYIPLFTRKNAVKYGNSYKKNGHWWNFSYKHDFESRLNFLNWMIKTIKNKIKMENPKIKSRFLTFEQQLRILEMVLKTIEEKKYKSGICNIIINILSNEEEFKRFNLFVLDRLFPLLTRKNAKKYGNSKETGFYWWEIDPFDFESRINFIRWMIKKINIELEDKKQSDYWWKNVYYDLKLRFNFTDKIIKKLHLNK